MIESVWRVTRLGCILREKMVGPNSSIGKLLCTAILMMAVAGCLGTASRLGGQVKAPDNSSVAERGVALASKGRCAEALPLLKKAGTQFANNDLKYDVLMSTVRCAMSLEQIDTAALALAELNRAFPDDPEVLFTSTHYYSELASRASQHLAATAPTSAQAEQLEAEAYESHGEWENAAAEYRKILEQHPQRRNIHYRLGRMFLSKTPPEVESAKRELDEELKTDPGNAAAEFLLGEISRQAGQWDDAIAHFTAASKLDQEFQEAYLALGMSLNSAGRFGDAIAPLERYVTMQPEDPAGHYQLGTAYSRTGRKEEAQREMRLQQETAAKSPRTAQP